MTAVHIALAIFEIGFAGLFAHRSIPSVRGTKDGRLRAAKMLLLAFTLAFAGLGQMTIVVNGETGREALLLGHLTLLAYAGISYWQLCRDGLVSWFHEGRDDDGEVPAT